MNGQTCSCGKCTTDQAWKDLSTPNDVLGGTLVSPKVYRVVDNSTTVLVTMDELKALRRYREIMDANEKCNTWAWIDEEILE